LFNQKKQRREMEVTEREQLLNRRFRANSETQIDMDYSLQQHNSMQNAHQGVDEMLMTGTLYTNLLTPDTDLLLHFVCQEIMF
jgi:golgi SNAP receptor complex member 2